MNREPIVIRTDGRSDELIPCTNVECDVFVIENQSMGDGLCTTCYFDAELIRLNVILPPEDDCS